jgi:hypothetical protein
MTISLPSLVPLVRDNLSDVPEELLNNVVITSQLKRAESYIGQICETDGDETYLKYTYVALATYYSYLSYTSLVERRMGTMPEFSSIKLNELKATALAFIKPIASYDVKDDLSVDEGSGKIAKPFVSYTTYTILAENDY